MVSRINLYMIAATMVTSFACSDQEEVKPTTNPEAESINGFIDQLPDWQTENVTEKAPVVLSDVMVPTGGGDPYKCQTIARSLVRTFQDIMSVETNFGTIWPGAFIQGNTLTDGELKTINVTRAPITIQIDIPLNEGSKKIDVPNSVTVQQAISDFQIAAGEMPEGSQSGAGVMNFAVEEAASFEQSMLAMGISGGFTEPQSQIGLEASANVSIERSFSEHTVIAKFVQQMFTVRLADDLIKEPADFFAPDVTLSDVQALESNGSIGAENIPLYIESVTYGRIMLFTMKSTSVSSGTSLSGALQASMADYANGGASLTDEQKEILQNTTTTIFSAGGTKEAANAAIANLNWGEFFKAAPATTAVPISFVAKTLNGKKIVKIIDYADYVQRDNCKAPSSYDITVTWTNNDYTGACAGGVACPQVVSVKSSNANSGTLLTALNSYSYTTRFTMDDSQPEISIRSIVDLLLPPTGLDTKARTTTHNVQTLKPGNTAVKHILENWAGSVSLDFVINKVANYDD